MINEEILKAQQEFKAKAEGTFDSYQVHFKSVSPMKFGRVEAHWGKLPGYTRYLYITELEPVGGPHRIDGADIADIIIGEKI